MFELIEYDCGTQKTLQTFDEFPSVEQLRNELTSLQREQYAEKLSTHKALSMGVGRWLSIVEKHNQPRGQDHAS